MAPAIARSEIVDDDDLAVLVARTRRLAFTNEALVSVSPGRDDRAAAAFVAATAHQLVFNAERIRAPEGSRSFLDAGSVSPDISAMLLFLVADASADAFEIALKVESERDKPIEGALIAALRASPGAILLRSRRLICHVLMLCES